MRRGVFGDREGNGERRHLDGDRGALELGAKRVWGATLSVWLQGRFGVLGRRGSPCRCGIARDLGSVRLWVQHRYGMQHRYGVPCGWGVQCRCGAPCS